MFASKQPTTDTVMAGLKRTLDDLNAVAASHAETAAEKRAQADKLHFEASQAHAEYQRAKAAAERVGALVEG